MLFYYKARDKGGTLIRGNLEAPSLREAKNKIFSLGLLPIDLSTEEKKSWLHTIQAFVQTQLDRVSLEEMLVFNQQFQTIYAVGIPLIRGLSLIAEQTENKYFRGVLKKIIGDVSNGESLQNAFSKHPRIFDSTYVNLVKSGTASGKLEQILGRISNLAEQRVQNTQKISSATFYPKIVFFVIIVVFFVVVYFVIPKIKTFFDQFQAQLPAITRFTLGLSDVMVKYWPVVGVVVFTVIFGTKKILSTKAGAETWDKYKLKIPIFGKLFRQIEINNFCLILELLINGGVPIVEALELTRDSLNNSVFKNEVTIFKSKVEQGGSLSKAMLESREFPQMVGSLITVGEEAGALPTVLNRVSSHYQMQINYKLENLSKTIEPILLVFIFGAVLVLALTVFLPLWKMSSVLKK